ncbi:MAG TPA: M48 family peptidase [Colwellia sp.]|nr:M48 family peptidase [Colwellia sp.]
MLKYQLIRSKCRKTLGLQVKYGYVIVRAPYYVTTKFIDTFIEEKSVWLLKKLVEQRKKIDFCDFTQDSSLLYLGEHLMLNICLAKKSNVFIDNNLATEVDSLSLYTPVPRQLNVVISERVSLRSTEPLVRAKRVKKLLENHFKQQAEKLIVERLEMLSGQTLLIPKKVNVRQYSARWGSCNNRGELSFNYLLMMAPIFVIDYVIIHELCHLKHLNHSKSFWQLVKEYSPEYQAAKEWLNTHQSQLHWQNPR